ncbi:hypothetical protein P8452_23520 [Trifolium repens]|nr:hypothetical protein P8452_23520 [Trifolium repens]
MLWAWNNVHKCVSGGGKVLIPTFALGRAQELCLLLDDYWERMNLKVPIYLSVGEKWEQLESNGVVILSISMVNKNFKDRLGFDFVCDDVEALMISNLVLEEEDEDGEEEEKETVEVVDEKEIVVVEEPAVRVQKRTVLRAGSEGEAVQEKALQKLGFYSGEEDMEFSSFSSGTERAVKTWQVYYIVQQSSLGVVGDGIMTSELL